MASNEGPKAAVRIYTKTGDQGETSLLGGKRVDKDDLRVSAYGTVDETSATLALGHALAQTPWVKQVIMRVLAELLVMGAELSSKVDNQTQLKHKITKEMIRALENDIDRIVAILPPLKGFVLSGQTPGEAALDMARTVARRAERAVITLSKTEKIREEAIQYLNRLSDLIYMLARQEAYEDLVRKIVTRIQEKMEAKQVNIPITLEMAERMAAAAAARATEISVPMVIAVTDGGGNPVLLHRMDNALLASVDIALNKAFTAVSLKMETAELAKLAAPGAPLFGINTSNNGKIIPFGGGLPIYRDSQIVGAIGVSGGSVDADIDVAKAGLSALNT